MARSLDHSRRADTDRMRVRGVDQVGDCDLPREFFSAPKKRIAKATLRAQAKAAIPAGAMLTKRLSCTACKHIEDRRVALSDASGPFACSRCGSATR